LLVSAAVCPAWALVAELVGVVVCVVMFLVFLRRVCNSWQFKSPRRVPGDLSLSLPLPFQFGDCCGHALEGPGGHRDDKAQGFVGWLSAFPPIGVNVGASVVASRL
jgi:hypothetical protein